MDQVEASPATLQEGEQARVPSWRAAGSAAGDAKRSAIFSAMPV